MNTEIEFVGGSEEDRLAILSLHTTYLEANNALDVDLLRTVWDNSDDTVLYNLNGHNYYGFEHWAKLWRHYKTQFSTSSPWIASKLKITIRGDMAFATCTRTSRLEWIGNEPQAEFAARELSSRSTEVFERDEKGWKVSHVHFSASNDGPRPGDI